MVKEYKNKTSLFLKFWGRQKREGELSYSIRIVNPHPFPKIAVAFFSSQTTTLSFQIQMNRQTWIQIPIQTQIHSILPWADDIREIRYL